MAGPQRDPEIATNLTEADDDLEEPTANRSPGWLFEEEIINAFFNWLGQTWGRWILDYAETAQRFANPLDAVEHSEVQIDSKFFLDTRAREDGETQRIGDLSFPSGTDRTFEYEEDAVNLEFGAKPVTADGQHVLVANQTLDFIYILDMRGDKITKVGGFPDDYSFPVVVSNGERWGVMVENITDSTTEIFWSDSYTTPTDVSDLNKTLISTELTPEDGAIVGDDGKLQFLATSGTETFRYDVDGNILQTIARSDGHTLAGLPDPPVGSATCVGLGVDTLDFNGTQYTIAQTGTLDIHLAATPGGYVAMTPDAPAGEPNWHFFGPQAQDPQQYEWTAPVSPIYMMHDGRFIYTIENFDNVEVLNPSRGQIIADFNRNTPPLSTGQIKGLAVNGAYLVIASDKDTDGEDGIYILSTSHAAPWRWHSTTDHTHLGQHMGPIHDDRGV